MKFIIGLLLVFAGVVIGLYVGGYLMFFKGVIDIIEQIKAPSIDTTIMAWAIVKVVLASAVGGLSAMVLVIPGMSMLDKKGI